MAELSVRPVDLAAAIETSFMIDAFPAWPLDDEYAVQRAMKHARRTAARYIDRLDELVHEADVDLLKALYGRG